MNLLDENFPEDQVPELRRLGVVFRRIGRAVAVLGIKDDNIIPILHRYRNVTFFTQDQGYFDRQFCHPAYCLVWLDVRPRDASEYVRRFLRLPRFDANAKRMGVVARVHHDGVSFWQRNLVTLQSVLWPEE